LSPGYAARPPVTATLDAVDMMPTGIDRLTAAPKANHLKTWRVSGYRQDSF
jgi:hypothetical protein